MGATNSQELDNCSHVFDLYKSIMNTKTLKDEIVQKLFAGLKNINKSVYFMGSYMSFPRDNTSLRDYYRDGRKSTVDAKLFKISVKEIKKNLTETLRHLDIEYIAFIIGGIVAEDNVSHHIGFIYGKRENVLKILDPGRQSWGPRLALVVQDVVTEVFSDLQPSYIQCHSTKWCSLCGEQKCGPQDITRGRYVEEAKTYISSARSIHRETFCQTWSILLILTEMEKILNPRVNPSYQFTDEKISYWDEVKSDLEFCIRRFILWIVKNNPEYFEWQYVGQDVKIYNNNIDNGITPYLTILLHCFSLFKPGITVPNQDEVICEGNLKI